MRPQPLYARRPFRDPIAAMSIFRFRRFSVENTESAMKVNTDGVLLGALMTLRLEERCMLDVGTGTGTIALMAAQRISDLGSPRQASITGIDIDGPSAREAARNFAASPWPGMLSAIHCSLADLDRCISALQPYSEPSSPVRPSLSEPLSPEPAALCPGSRISYFDHIFSNPPYYDLSLRAPDFRRNTARHTDSLSYRDLIGFASSHLSDSGVLSLILPADTETWLLRHARMSGLHPFRIVRIRTTPKKRPSRIVAEFSRSAPALSESLLTLSDGGSCTPEYLALTRDFYLWPESCS